MSVWRKILLFPVTRILLWGALDACLIFGSSRFLPPGWFWSYGAMTVAGLLSLLFIGAVIERRPLSGYGLGTRHLFRDLAGGFGIAAAMMSAVIGLLALGGWYHVESFQWNGRLFASALAMNLLVGINEEVALRGVFFRMLEEGVGSWISLGASALLFGLLHLGNQNATVAAAVSIAVEAGILLAAAFMLTRSLWLAIGMHWAWNFFQGAVFGAPVSGSSAGQSLIRATFDGPALMTGGAFGPEAGLVALVIGLGVGIALLMRAIRRGRIIAPAWRRPRY